MMLKFGIKRILQMLPLLLGVLFLSFIFQELWPLDPVEHKFRAATFEGVNTADQEAFILEEKRKLGLDLPLFYFGLTPMSDNNPIPTVSWNGTESRFHIWLFGSERLNLKGLFQGNLGRSYLSGEPVSSIIAKKWSLSFYLSLFSLIIAFGITIAISRKVFEAKGRKKAAINKILYILYACPSFVAGMLLLYFFANKSMLYWFPSGGWGNLFDENSLFDLLPYMVLPLITLSYGSVTFLTHLHQQKLKEEEEKPYIQTAHAKGLHGKSVYWNHLFKNSLFPLITAFGAYLPSLVAGSVIVESLFNIPGIGQLTFLAVEGGDFPVITALFLLSALLTMLGYLVSDLLYHAADPRAAAHA